MDWPPTRQTNMEDSQKRPYSQLATCHIARWLQHQYPPASSAARMALQRFTSESSCQDFLHHSAGLPTTAEPFPTVMSFSQISLATSASNNRIPNRGCLQILFTVMSESYRFFLDHFSNTSHRLCTQRKPE